MTSYHQFYNSPEQLSAHYSRFYDPQLHCFSSVSTSFSTKGLFTWIFMFYTNMTWIWGTDLRPISCLINLKLLFTSWYMRRTITRSAFTAPIPFIFISSSHSFLVFINWCFIHKCFWSNLSFAFKGFVYFFLWQLKTFYI